MAKVKLVKESLGGLKLVTKDYKVDLDGKIINGEAIENVFVKSWERVEDSVTRVTVELICIVSEDGKNW